MTLGRSGLRVARLGLGASFAAPTASYEAAFKKVSITSIGARCASPSWRRRFAIWPHATERSSWWSQSYARLGFFVDAPLSGPSRPWAWSMPTCCSWAGTIGLPAPASSTPSTPPGSRARAPSGDFWPPAHDVSPAARGCARGDLARALQCRAPWGRAGLSASHGPSRSAPASSRTPPPGGAICMTHAARPGGTHPDGHGHMRACSHPAWMWYSGPNDAAQMGPSGRSTLAPSPPRNARGCAGWGLHLRAEPSGRRARQGLGARKSRPCIRERRDRLVDGFALEEAETARRLCLSWSRMDASASTRSTSVYTCASDRFAPPSERTQGAVAEDSHRRTGDRRQDGTPAACVAGRFATTAWC